MTKANKDNAMAKDRPICSNLQRHYDLPTHNKLKFLESNEARCLFDNLPVYVSTILKEAFLSDVHGTEVADWRKIVDYFNRNSRIIPALTENPGTFTMLEKMYHFEAVHGPIDNYFLQCKAGGQALKNRYYAVNLRACDHVKSVLAANKGEGLMLDIGSGPGRNGIEMCLRHPEFNGNIRIDCIDIDPAAVKKGEELVE
ncbi:MAG: class I SAM-dependent methyltransferase [Deltaproteobacteria bacterium]|nr:class I SAM-dependent methyltransferase [Deltaproteobacteria bacterium]